MLQAWVFTDFGPVEVALFHTMSSIGLIALLWGVAKRDDERVPLIALIALCSATGVIVCIARVNEVQSVLLMVQNSNAGFLFALGAYRLWQTERRQMADKALLTAFLLLAAYSMYRPAITIILDSGLSMDQYQSSAMLAANMAISAVLCLLLSIALLATVVSDTIDEAKQAATQDPLTGLPNRSAFEDKAQDMLSRAMMERVPVSLIVGDIDHFKRVNDTYGHAVGDKVIAGFGKLLAAKIRPHDAAGRIGGEEFCVIAWNCTEDGASALADRLRKSFVEVRNEALPKEEVISASFGVAQFRPGADYARTFERADAALYVAKRSGRNRVVGDQGGDFAGLPMSEGEASALIDADISAPYGAKSGAEIVSLTDRQAHKHG